jgi:hypothetical protein
LPLVPSNRPGTLQLTVERIAELLDQEDFIPDAPEKQDV